MNWNFALSMSIAVINLVLMFAWYQLGKAKSYNEASKEMIGLRKSVFENYGSYEETIASLRRTRDKQEEEIKRLTAMNMSLKKEVAFQKSATKEQTL